MCDIICISFLNAPKNRPLHKTQNNSIVCLHLINFVTTTVKAPQNSYTLFMKSKKFEVALAYFLLKLLAPIENKRAKEILQMALQLHCKN